FSCVPVSACHPLFPYSTLFRSLIVFVPIVILGNGPFIAFVYAMATIGLMELTRMRQIAFFSFPSIVAAVLLWLLLVPSTAIITRDRKSTRLNSSHVSISYAVFC